MKLRLYTYLVIFSLLVLTGSASSVSAGDGWSPTVNGLQSRLTLIQSGNRYGVRWLVPYLELRNVRDLGSQMEVNCDRQHLSIELVNAKGEPIRSNSILIRSGPAPELNTIILPWHSSMILSLENTNWGISPNAPTMISTDSRAWVIKESEKGKVFLRAKLTDEPIKTPFSQWKRWYGTIQTPLIKVDWK